MKYDKDTVDKLIESLNRGTGRIVACKDAGISFNTFWRWINEDDKSDFRDAIKKAELTGRQVFKEECVSEIKKATAWQAKAWLLERMFPDEFAANRNIDTADQDTDVVIVFEREDNEAE